MIVLFNLSVFIVLRLLEHTYILPGCFAQFGGQFSLTNFGLNF